MKIALPDLAAMEAFGQQISAKLAPGEGEVPSPTYTIIETYDGLPVPLVHADFYRLEDPAEAAELGLDDYREGAALLAEWPDHAGGFAHEPNCLAIALEKVGEGREAVVTPGTSWQSRWP